VDEREMRRFKLWKRIRSQHGLISEEQAKLNIMKNKLRELKLDYEELDRELMMEKRTMLAPQGKPKKRERKVCDLSIKEVQDIAKKLGIMLDIK